MFISFFVCRSKLANIKIIMKEKDIKQKDEPVLRMKARAVTPEEIGSENLTKILANMQSALHDTNDGVAIAAPQIGVSLRIFLVHGSVFADRADTPDEDKVFINPEIISTSSRKELIDEGCLSVRRVYGKIERSTQATVRAQNEHGETFEMGASGLLAQIFQHETDHLNGILFIDKASELREIPQDTEQDNQESSDE